MKAGVVLKDDHRASMVPQDSVGWAPAQRAAYKVPRIAEFVDELPDAVTETTELRAVGADLTTGGFYVTEPDSKPVCMERALVSGATSGIGRAIAIRLGRRGATVGIMGRNVAAAKQVAAEVVQAGGAAVVVQADVADAAQVARAVQKFVAEHGGIETVVASAGVLVTGSVTDSSLEDWHRVRAINLDGTFYLARFTVPELIKSRGTFTAISSDAGVQGACGFAAYATMKHALHGLIKCMALDYGRFGVRSNAVCPAFVETPMTENVLKAMTPAEIAYYKGIVPLARFATADEVADAVAHLSSDEARYVNGLMYKLDGGSTAGYYLAT